MSRFLCAILGCSIPAIVLSGCGGGGGGGGGGNEGVLQFNAPGYSVNENGTPVTIITLIRSGGVGAISVTVTFSDGTATSPADYDSTSQVVSWAAGDTSDKTIAVPIVNDHEDEPDETLAMHLATPTGGAVTGPMDTATLTILDDDVAGQVEFEFAQRFAGENGQGAFVRLIRSGGMDGDVSITVTSTDVTANSDPNSLVEPLDYAAVSMTLTFPDQDTTPIIVPLSIVQDLLPEIDETFTLNLGNPTHGLVVGPNGTSTVTIVDDDLLLELDGGLLNQFFGTSLVKAGPFLLVGAPGQQNGNGGMIIQTVDFPTPPNLFLNAPPFATHMGQSASFSGNTLAMGGLNTVRVIDVQFNPLQFDLRFDVTNPADGFGSRVFVNGSRVFASAPDESASVGFEGRVFPYDAITGTPAPPLDGAPFTRLGASMAMFGSDLVVGAAGIQGQLRFFDGATLAPLTTAANPLPQGSPPSFGASIAVLDLIPGFPEAVVGVPDSDTFAPGDGAAYLLTGGAPPVVLLAPPPAVPDGRFGANVLTTSTGRICVQQPGGGLFGSGRVFVFDSTGAFVATIDCPVPSPDAGFGSAMIEYDGALVIGAPRAPAITQSGIVFVFKVP